MSVIEQMPELGEALVKCCQSVQTMCQTFFPDRFYYPFSEAHKEVCSLLDDDSVQLLAIAAWRGFGKTSIVQTALPAQRILFRRTNFMVPISATSHLAVLQSENLKGELLRNELIRKVWPDIRSDNFSKEMWIANTGDIGTLVLPRGSGQQIRGLLFGGHRPDLFIVDDLEDSDSVLNPQLRDDLMRWFYTDVMGATERGSNKARIIVIGTILHEESLLSKLLEDPNWTSVRYELCNDEFKSNWPEQMSDEAILAEYRKFQERGLANEFHREYRNIPIVSEKIPIKPDMFKYFTQQDLRDPDVEYVVIVDPAKTTGSISCDTAIVGCGINNRKSEIYVVDIAAGQFHPDEMYRTALSMCQRLNTNVLGIEVTGLDEYVLWPLKSAISRSGNPLQVIELRPKRGSTMYIDGRLYSGKESRIAAALVPLYREGLIKHNKNHHLTPALEGQLLSFLRGGKKDIADALSYVVGMMDKGERFFMPEKFSAEDATPEQLINGFLDPEYERRALEKLVYEDKRMRAREVCRI